MNALWRHEVHTLETGESWIVRLGEPRRIAERHDSEWNFDWSDNSATERDSNFERGRAGANAGASVFNCRYSFREMLPAMHFAPNLADRPLTIRPDSFMVSVILAALDVLGVGVGVLLGAVGILSLGIDFASQTSLPNMICGLFPIGERFSNPGDVIQIGTLT